jgi:two-component system, cell cycle sensor histidine kinase and response regulator CckA
MPEPLRLLMAEDSAEDAALLEAELRAGGYAPDIRRVLTEGQFRAALEGQEWDLAILDFTLPQFSALRALEILRAEASAVPALVVSATVGEDELVGTVRAGAADYIQKHNLSRLVPAIRRELEDAKGRRERHRAERALRESEERFRFALDHAGGVFYRLRHADMKYEYMSPGIEAVTGYTAEELKELDFHSLITMVSEPAGVARARPAGKDGRVDGRVDEYRADYQFRARSGALKWVSVHSFPWRDEAGTLLGSVGLLMDITERRRTEERLRSSEEHLRALLDASLAAIVSMDAGGKVTYWSRQASEIFGWAEKEAVGQPLADLIMPPAVRSAHAAGLRRYLETGQSRVLNRRVELTALRRDGRELPVELTVVAVPGRGFTAFVNDITTRKQAEAALRRSEEHFRSLIENASDMIVVADTSQGITYVSPSVERVLGYPPAERLGRSPLELVHPEDRARMQQVFADTARAGSPPEPARVRLRHKDGTWRTLEAVARKQAQEGLVGGIVINARDITERESLEAQLLQAQKIEAVGRLAGGIAHDFNNLVTAILGYADLSLRRLPAQDPLRRNVEEITRAAERAAALTQQLLAFSRKQVLQPRVLDLREVFDRAQGLLHRLIGEDIEVVIRAAPEVGRVRADPVQLEQVLLNLAINARDAMPQGGRLVLEAGNADLDEAYARDHLGGRPGPFVLLAVSDTGHGMDRETQEHIFEPFFTTKEMGKGTGLGLSTVYGIVKQSGGYIWVDSEPGKGTTFKVYLPRVLQDPAEMPAEAPVPAAAARGSETVLLVEDEDSVRELVQELLEAVGYHVLTAARPADALRLADDYAGPLHLLVTDVVMPQMGGPDLAQRLKGLRPDLKVLYLSGYSPGIVADRGVLEDGAMFLQKPFSADALESKVRETLDTP